MAANNLETVDLMLKAASRLQKILHDLTDAYIRMIKILLVRRNPPLTQNVTGHNYNVEGIKNAYDVLFNTLKSGIKFGIGSTKIVCEYINAVEEMVPYENDSNATYVHENDIIAFQLYWSDITEKIETGRKTLVTVLSRVFQLELERSEFFISLLKFIMAYEDQLQETVEDIPYFGEIWNLYSLWSPWLRCAPLVIEFEPGSIPLDVFLDITDGIHIFYYDLFVSMCMDDTIGEEYRQMGEIVIKKGFPGPDYLIDVNAEEMKNFIRKETKAYRCALRLKAGYSQHFPDEVYQRILTNALRKYVPIAGDLYTEMRRSLVATIRWFYGAEHLKTILVELLTTELGLQFCKCTEILKSCRILAKITLACADDQVVYYESIADSKLVPIIKEMEDFPAAFYGKRNFLLSKLIRSEHRSIKEMVIYDVTRFMIRISEMLNNTGYYFQNLPEKIRLDLTNIVVCLRELVKYANNAINDSSRVLPQLVSIEWFSVAPYEFRDCMRAFLPQIDRFCNACAGRPWITVSAIDFFLSIPLTRSIRRVAQVEFGVPTENGVIAPIRQLNPDIKVEIKHLNADPTNPLEDSFMSEKAFKKLVSSMIRSNIEPNEPGLAFTR